MRKQGQETGDTIIHGSSNSKDVVALYPDSTSFLLIVFLILVLLHSEYQLPQKEQALSVIPCLFRLLTLDLLIPSSYLRSY